MALSKSNALVTGAFLFTGAINVLPLFREDKFRMLGTGNDLAVLMRHRSVLFGLVGSYLCMAAFMRSLRSSGFIVGLSSMVSYVAIVVTSPGGLLGLHDELQKDFWMDLIGSATLCIGAVFNNNIENKEERV